MFQIISSTRCATTEALQVMRQAISKKDVLNSTRIKWKFPLIFCLLLYILVGARARAVLLLRENQQKKSSFKQYKWKSLNAPGTDNPTGPEKMVCKM